MMRFLVTGGAGFIGSHIAEELLEPSRGEVLILDNLSVGKRENVPDGASLIEGDLKDREILRQILPGIDVVFHNAAFVSIRGSFEKLEKDLEVNCMGTLNLLRESAEAHVKKFIFASSMAVYGDAKMLPVCEEVPPVPNSPYGLSKVRGEMYCRIFQEKFGIQTIVLRYFNTFGPRQTPSAYVGVLTTFINQALDGRPLTIFGDGRQSRDFVGVKDVARANILALDCPQSGIFNVGSGTEVTINEIAEEILRYIGGGERVHLPAPPGEVPRMLADIERARKILGFVPQEEIKKSIPGLIEEWKKLKGLQ